MTHQKYQRFTLTIEILIQTILISWYPILLLIALNINVLDISTAYRSLKYSTIIFGIIFIFILLLSRSLIKSNLITSILVIYLFLIMMVMVNQRLPDPPQLRIIIRKDMMITSFMIKAPG